MSAIEDVTIGAIPEPVAAPAGLDEREAEARAASGMANVAPTAPSRTLGAIVRGNVLTRFNAILGTLLIVILLVGPLRDALFGIVLVANAGIGIVQEWRAKRTLDRLSLINTRRVTVMRSGRPRKVPIEGVVAGDVIGLAPGDQVVADGLVLVSNALEVDESLLTGEAEPEPKRPGDTVLSGSLVTAGRGWCRADRVGASAYASRLAIEARRFSLVRSELRNGINQILRLITWVLVPTAVVLVWSQIATHESVTDALRGSVAGLVAMIPEGLVLLTSIAFAAGVVRLGRRRVLVQDLAAIEGLARVDVVCIDKTGTITQPELDVAATEALVPDLDLPTLLGGLVALDPDPNASARAIAVAFPGRGGVTPTWRVPFSSARRYSVTGVRGGGWVLGAPDVLVAAARGDTTVVADRVERHARAGRRVLLVAWTPTGPTEALAGLDPVGLVALEERIRPDARSTLEFLAAQGIDVKVLSGDAPTTVAAVARRAGITGADEPIDARSLPVEPSRLGNAVESHNVFGRVDPHHKRAMIKALQQRGRVVAMTGDGVNDVLALKEADLGVAMGSGSSASRAVAHVVLLDSSFAALPSLLAEGRRVIANIERVANLFVTKTVYATLLALAVGVAGLPFPFLPRHLTVVSTLTIGIPAFFLALARNQRRSRPGFVRRVVRFAVPAGAVTAAATLAAYSLARAHPDVSPMEAQTAATLVLVVVALWVLAVLARPAAPWRTALVSSMAAGFAVVVSVAPVSAFFSLALPSLAVTAASLGIAALAGAVLEVIWRTSGRRTPTPEDAARKGEPIGNRDRAEPGESHHARSRSPSRGMTTTAPRA